MKGTKVKEEKVREGVKELKVTEGIKGCKGKGDEGIRAKSVKAGGKGVKSA